MHQNKIQMDYVCRRKCDDEEKALIEANQSVFFPVLAKQLITMRITEPYWKKKDNRNKNYNFKWAGEDSIKQFNEEKETLRKK